MLEMQERRTLEEEAIRSIDLAFVSSAVEMSEIRAGGSLDVDASTQGFDSNPSPSTPERVDIYKSLFSNPVWKAFSSVIIFMLAIFEVINKDNVVSFFEKHPAILRVFIIAPIIHFFAIAAKSVLPPDTRNSLIAGFVAFFSGALFVILAIWIVLPSWLGWPIFVMWCLLVVLVGCNLLFPGSIQNLYQKSIKKLFNTSN